MTVSLFLLSESCSDVHTYFDVAREIGLTRGCHGSHCLARIIKLRAPQLQGRPCSRCTRSLPTIILTAVFAQASEKNYGNGGSNATLAKPLPLGFDPGSRALCDGICTTKLPAKPKRL